MVNIAKHPDVVIKRNEDRLKEMEKSHEYSNGCPFYSNDDFTCCILDDDSTTRNDILAKRFVIPYEREDVVEILKVLKQIREICKSHEYCEDCPLHSDAPHCLLYFDPASWDLYEIEKRLYG